MTEFEIFKAAFERCGDEIRVEEWKIIGEAMIENKTRQVDFYFKDGKLDDVWNVKEV